MNTKKYYSYIYWIIFGLLVVYMSYSKGWISNTTPSITPQQAYSELQKHSSVFLDVRTNEEYNAGHIPGAILVPVDQVEQSTIVKKLKNDSIIVYCHSGNRSLKASRILEKQGYKVYNLENGITNWESQHLPTEP